MWSKIRLDRGGGPAYGIDRVLVGCAGVLVAALTVPLLVPGTRRLARPDPVTPTAASVPPVPGATAVV